MKHQIIIKGLEDLERAAEIICDSRNIRKVLKLL